MEMCDQSADPVLLSILHTFVQGVYTEEAYELSLLFFLTYLRSGGNVTVMVEDAQSIRVSGGAQTMADYLASQIGADKILFKQPVRAFKQSETAVTIHTDQNIFHAKYVICTIPLNLLHRLTYEPPLPAARTQLSKRSVMGSIIKILVFYEQPFWRQAGYSGFASDNSRESGPINFTYDASSKDDSHYALVAFIAGRNAQIWSRQPEQRLKQAVLKQLSILFDSQIALTCKSFVYCDWSKEEWSEGGYSIGLPPGVMTQYGDVIRQPFQRIHFAGTETAVHWAGYMEGAVESGERAAEEVLLRL
eukprot:TRINITY_DN7915_c0_g1_i2.p1 TRINITY_DN7915_c0_g1~~TRINITY_DN7915_c0_g1_i2.p1  ORF type:complete len:304 (-),score=47.80 TRINITY_DN7915_c0_g1_i2:62-973(-)